MQSDKNTAHLLLGSNLGNRDQLIVDAIQLITERVGEVMQTSAIYETAAWGKTEQPSFLNVALAVKTLLSPLHLLETVLQIEVDLGRIRYEKWGSRLIDIDILLYGAEIISVEDRLQIPHPQLQHRKFALLPLSDIAPDVIHPILRQRISELLVNLEDELEVLKR